MVEMAREEKAAESRPLKQGAEVRLSDVVRELSASNQITEAVTGQPTSEMLQAEQMINNLPWLSGAPSPALNDFNIHISDWSKKLSTKKLTLDDARAMFFCMQNLVADNVGLRAKCDELIAQQLEGEIRKGVPCWRRNY